MANVLISTEHLSHEEWLQYRNLGLGGSDASVVCGINKWKSPIELWMEKTGQYPPQEVGEPAYWGNRLEDLVKEEFTIRTGIEVHPVKEMLQSEDYPWMLANVDGVCEHPEYGMVIFEAKTTSFYRGNEWGDGVIPDEYLLQLQHYLAVTGFGGGYIAVLIGGNKFKYQFVERDDELISMLTKLESEFWELVQSNTPPALDGSDASGKFIKEYFPNSIPDTSVELPDEASYLIEQYGYASHEIKRFEEVKQEADNKLKQFLGSNEVGIINDSIVTWKSFEQERLDSKSFKSDHPTLHKKYCNKITSRRFSVKSAKEEGEDNAET